MDTLGVGIIGFGFIGKMHTYGYLNMPLFYDPTPVRTRMVGVATSRKDTAQKAAQTGGFEFGTDNWRELIERDDIDIINICTPDNLHAEQLLAAMSAGKHIYCDKPLVVNREDAEQVAEGLRTYQGFGQMTLQYRFYPATLRAKQLVDEGFLGNITGFRAAYLHSGSVDPRKPMGWKQRKSEGGGVLHDLGSHIIDLIDYLAGPVVSIFAEKRILYPTRPDRHGGMVPVEVDDQTVMIARLSNGAIGTIEASKIATGSEDELRFEIHGDQGALRFNLMEPNYLECYDEREPESPYGGQKGWRKIATVQRYGSPAVFPGPKFGIGWTRGHMHCLYSFLSAIADGRQPEPSLQRGLDVCHILATAQRSSETRQWQNVPTREV